MSTSILAILMVVYFLASIIIGIYFGNEKLKVTEGHYIKGWYFIWFVIKTFFISFILFAIMILIMELFLKQDFWGYLLMIIFGVADYYYARNHVIVEYKIMFKPGEGLLTPEGKARFEKYSDSVS